MSEQLECKRERRRWILTKRRSKHSQGLTAGPTEKNNNQKIASLANKQAKRVNSEKVKEKEEDGFWQKDIKNTNKD